MRGLFRTIFLFSFIGLFFGFVGNIGGSALKKDAVYLLLGLDDAAQNADSIILVSYSEEDNLTSIIQIPRDSYAEYGSKNKKINGIYSYYLSSGYSPSEALDKSADYISEKFGVDIDGSFAITVKAFSALVDSLGGVEINLPNDFEIKDSRGEVQLSLKAGINLIDGRDAELFVRHRKSFVTGDLGRIENQRIFLGGFLKTLFSDFSVEKIRKAYRAMGEGFICDASFVDLTLLATRYAKRIIKSDLVFFTLPGKAVKDKSGIWYYIIDLKEADELFGDGFFYSKKQNTKRKACIYKWKTIKTKLF